MKQLTGITLADVLASTDPELAKKYSRQRLLRAFTDVCLAIEFAHTRGVVHRDLKPANIVLGDFGEVYVLDWGIARVATDDATRASFPDVAMLDTTSTVAGAILGTPGYMSPEQVRGEPDLDGRSDVYALGCILYEILAAAPLHPRGHASLASTLDGVVAKPSERAPERDIAPELDAICLAATMLDRGDRYATARELGDAVQRFLDGDRDLAQRKELARTELDTARAALERGNGATERRQAIRAAARALALDPHAREPAELVGRLMLEPPSEVPAEVEAEIGTLEDSAMRAQARLSALAVSSYFAFFPLMYWAGFRDTWYLITGPILVAVLLVSALWLAKRPAPAIGWTSFALNAVVICFFARVLTPFVVAPGLALISAMIYSMHPTYRKMWIVYVGTLAAVFVPLGAELAGAVSQTTMTVGRYLVFRTTGHPLDEAATLVGLGLFVALIVLLAIFMSRSLANDRTQIQRKLYLQAWQLRQLVPRGQTAAG
jgi:serine/threonine-protein kinase